MNPVNATSPAPTAPANPAAARPLGGWTMLAFGVDMPWEDLQSHGFRRRNTCLIQALAKRPEIDRIYLINSVTREKYRDRMGRRRAGPAPEPAAKNGDGADGKVVDLYVTRALPERPWAPFIAAINRRLAARALRAQLPALDPARTIVWCYWPAAYERARDLGIEGKLVFDADNDLISCPNMRQTRPDFEALMEEIAGRAAAVVCGWPALLEWCAARGAARTARLRNGVDASRFESTPAAPAAPPGDPAPARRPRIGYVGTISRWMDFEMLERLAARRPDWTFIMVGKPYRTEIPEKLRGLANVEWLGQRAAGEVPAIMRSFDAGLVPYRIGSEGAGDSMKVFEYLAAGLPVVAAPFHDHVDRDYSGLVELAVGAEAFERSIERALARTGAEKAAWDARRAEFLAENTWDARAGEVVELLESLK